MTQGAVGSRRAPANRDLPREPLARGGTRRQGVYFEFDGRPAASIRSWARFLLVSLKGGRQPQIRQAMPTGSAVWPREALVRGGTQRTAFGLRPGANPSHMNRNELPWLSDAPLMVSRSGQSLGGNYDRGMARPTHPWWSAEGAPFTRIMVRRGAQGTVWFEGVPRGPHPRRCPANSVPVGTQGLLCQDNSVEVLE